MPSTARTFIQTTRPAGPPSVIEIRASWARHHRNREIKAGDFVFRFHVAPRLTEFDAWVRTFFPVVVVWIDRAAQQARVEHPDGEIETVSTYFVVSEVF